MTLSLIAMRMLVAVVEEGSFTGAARRENATQSGVSQHIQKLEDRFGVRLIEREPGGARPTPAGDRLYSRCVHVLRGASEAEEEMRGFGRGLDGEAAIGLMSALTRCVLGPTLRGFMQVHPNASIRIAEAVSDQLIERVSASALDAAVVPTIDPVGPLDGRALPSVPEMFVSRVDRTQDHMIPIDLRTVRPLRLVMPPKDNLRTRRVLAHLALQGAEIDDVLELDSMFGAFDFVANSDYVALIPAIMVLPEIRDASLCVRPLAGPPLTLDLMAIQPRRRSLSPVASAFLAALERQLQFDAVAWRP
ncbi:transcriptional regulator, LysR family protein [alpha proteobacterium BAL199]|jgi:LysR family transcriptional regulator, nitrogen assimilation regulatory protein|nr:transcriptional regulator, LysR family protein [alpha proteobacterium BAL199]